MDDELKPENTRRRFERQFNTRLSLENCHAHLRNRAEKATLWAWKGQTRIEVDTWRVDNDAVGFMIYRAPKSMLTFNFGTPTTRARGALFRQADGSTTVLVYAGTTLLGYIIHAFVMVMLWGALSAYLWAGAFGRGLWYLLLIDLALLVALAPLSRLYFDYQHRSLLAIVEDALRANFSDFA